MEKSIFGIVIILVIILVGICYFFFIRENKVPVITFHNVLEELEDESSEDISVSKFEKYIKWLSDNNYYSLSMNEFFDYKVNNKKIPRKSVLITFDDGWSSFYTKAMQILSHSYNLHDRENAYIKDYDIYNNDIKKVTELASIPMEYYAYPFGYNNKKYISALKDNDYKLAFTFGPYDFARKKDDNYKVPRLGIFESTSLLKFKLKMFLEM